MDVSAVEIRVLGCLIEKQRTTPDAYPLSLNALRLACNQTTNRDPVVSYDEEMIRGALHRLGRRRFTRLTSGHSSRAAKYRHLLDEAKAFAGRGSLIPRESRYVDQLRRFEHQCRQSSIHRVHGHRHAYAQERYQELTGWSAPAAGGPPSQSLTPEQKGLDQEARLTISRELGHEREAVTAVYLGR